MSNALHKRPHLRRTCRKCGAKLVNKPEYGTVCPECGWTKKNAYTDKEVQDDSGRNQSREKHPDGLL